MKTSSSTSSTANSSKATLRSIVISLLKSGPPAEERLETLEQIRLAVSKALGKKTDEHDFSPFCENRIPDYKNGLSETEYLLVEEIFWDLFREGIITLGCDSSNLEFPFFRIHSEAKF